MEYQPERCRIVQSIRRLLREKPKLDGRSANAGGVDPVAIVAHRGGDRITLALKRKRHLPSPDLVGRAPGFGQFDAMVDGVAHEVEQRFEETVGDLLVHLDRFPKSVKSTSLPSPCAISRATRAGGATSSQEGRGGRE